MGQAHRDDVPDFAEALKIARRVHAAHSPET
jgi:hypothetical protein